MYYFKHVHGQKVTSPTRSLTYLKTLPK